MRRSLRFLAALVLMSAATATAGPAYASDDAGRVAVIVEAASTQAAAHAVESVGGTVDLSLSNIAAVGTHLSADAVVALDANPAVRVIPDLTLHPTSDSFDASLLDPQISAIDPGAAWSPDAGRGVGVALIDTGVVDTPDLHGSRLIRSPDFSDEGDGVDHYGHGTFMAGLIAGDGTASTAGPTRHLGAAPGASLISVKVADAHGSSTMSRVIAGIGWAVAHRDTYNIGVLNLSFGLDTPLPYLLNPLDAASEAAWAAGITVVASAGNNGERGVTSPGDDPYVITVGATDTMGTATTNDDTVPTWSGRERVGRNVKPEIVAPGVSLVSLRAPGSTIDVQHPEGRVEAAYFRGSGTSMSTALVSGAVAVLLSHHGNATPDDVKGALVDGATSVGGGERAIDLDAAENATARSSWWQRFPVAFDGLGRGLQAGMPWSASRWTNATWSASRWTASRWTASRWTASRWTASDWSASRWTASRWTASRWTADSWVSQSWG